MSFSPMGVALAALSAFLLGIFWIYRGVNMAYQKLALQDQEASERIKDFVLNRKNDSGYRPMLVAFGGGTGLSFLLKGIKEFPLRITAVVTVTDDGGSSGRLRKEMQILPPGDIRNCLVALSQSESLMAKLFQFRFNEAGEFSGHSFGNLFIAAMTELLGDFGSAVREASNILATRGSVVPVTCENIQLKALFQDGTETIGETSITAVKKTISEIQLIPSEALPNPEALNAIDQADLIVLGPGSLFTSIIPNLLVNEISERINKSKAPVVYVCNVMTQPGETDNFSASDHVSALLEKTPLRKIDYVVVNSRRAARILMMKYTSQGQSWVPPTVTQIEKRGIKVISGDFLYETDLLRHNPGSLAKTLFELISTAMVVPKDR
ncbi:MAG: YvcK family protein [Candidatus Riflebacteria bacterium]|nr:YvcK family protein [Candidatus Riflebacteria bacterium]